MKNLYQILGVLDTAEDIVIRAAYKALAQRYHPDKVQGNAEETHIKMREINDAYKVLSDPIQRKKYDESINKKEYHDSTEYEESPNDPIEEAWKIGVEFFPDLAGVYKRLRKMNYALGNTFRLLIVENKKFNKAKEIADAMEMEFLKRYFGENQEIIKFAKLLIMHGNKEGIKKLNQYITVMGNSVPPEMLISKVRNESTFTYSNEVGAAFRYQSSRSFESAKEFLYFLGFQISMEKGGKGEFLDKFTISRDGVNRMFNAQSLMQYAERLSSDLIRDANKS